MSTPFLQVKKPISALRKPITPKWGGLFKALTRAVGTGLTLQWEKTVESLVDMGTSLGLDTGPEERAGALVLRALARAVAELVSEHRNELPEKIVDEAQIEHLDEILDAHELEIDRSFLDQPAKVKLPEIVAPLLAEWFEKQGVDPGNREGLAARLRAYFVYALIAEWRRKPGDYTPILDALNTPFARAGERELAWQEYAARLRQQVNQPMLGEHFGLEQVYVPLRAAHLIGQRDDKRAVFQQRRDLERLVASKRDDEPATSQEIYDWVVLESPIALDYDESAIEFDYEPFFSARPEDEYLAVRLYMDRERLEQRVVMLHEHLHAWLDMRDKDDAIRLLSGGPGSGKSSFAKMFAANLAEHRRVVFIPLFDLDLGESLPTAVDAYVQRKGLPFSGLLTAKSLEEHLLIIFDGLDELSIRGALGMETARDFLLQVERVSRDMNFERCRLHVLVTGRELAIQGAASVLREPERVLHVLPYYVPPHVRARYEDPRGYLAEDQRLAWWAKYAVQSGRQHRPIPHDIVLPELEDLTAEPLLCYLITFGYYARHIDLSTKALDLGRIYAGLLDAVYSRSYEQRHRSLARVPTPEDFAAVLEEIGLAAWHGSGRTTTISTIREYCKRNRRLEKLLQDFEADTKAGVASLLLAFYFRQSDKQTSGEPTFEFTHLSFAEYLTARRLVHGAERITKLIKRGDEGDEEGWDEREALHFWVTLAGPSAMEANLVRFLRIEFAALPGEDVSECQSVFCRLVGHMLRQGMPMELLQPRLSYQEEVEQAIHAEVALFVVLQACAQVTETQSEIRWPSPLKFGTWLRRVMPQRAGSRAFGLSFLSYLGLARVILISADLQGAIMRKTDLHYTNLARANLRRADLNAADMRRANLQWAVLRKADLQGANLAGADLRYADLQEANLHNADLQDADLRSANLRGANLIDANLQRAELTGATLHRAHLEGADLRSARLGGELNGARYSPATKWPQGFDPDAVGCMLVD